MENKINSKILLFQEEKFLQEREIFFPKVFFFPVSIDRNVSLVILFLENRHILDHLGGSVS